MPDRYRVTTFHGEGATLYHVVDGEAPEGEQPAVVESFSTKGHSGAHSCAIYRAECLNGRGYHPGLTENVGRYARSVETGWLGKIVDVETSNGEAMFKMQGVNMLYRTLKGGDIEDALDDDDTQWFAPADVSFVEIH